MVAAGIGEVAVAGGETTVNRLDADAARQLLTRLVRPTGVRARLFSETGELLGDSAILSDAGRIHVMPLPPPQAAARPSSRTGATASATGSPASSRASTASPNMSSAPCPTVRDFPEAASALRGFNASAVRIAPDGMLILSAAVPVQRYKQVLGALMLTRDNRAIAASLREVRYDMMVIAAAALGITVLLSLYLAGTITQPIVRLARAADEVRLARESRPEIPDLGKRGDEIGDLNDALRSMTDALWQRIGTIESFAADVAHELKNPLTSLRSAIEVAARPNLEPERRDKLMAIVVDDINRLNRLITDISDASRLDAELMRGEVKKVDLNALLGDMVNHYAATAVAERRRRGRVSAGRQPAVPGARPRRPLRPGVPQRHRQCACRSARPARRSWSSSAARRAAGRSPSPSTTRGRAFPRTISNRSSSASTRSGRPSISASIRGSGLSICRQIMETYGGSISRLQPPGCRRPRARRPLHRARAGGRRPQVICSSGPRAPALMERIHMRV